MGPGNRDPFLATSFRAVSGSELELAVRPKSDIEGAAEGDCGIRRESDAGEEVVKRRRGTVAVKVEISSELL